MREGNGRRARRDDVYSLRRYVRRLKGCLQNARVSYNRLQATLDDSRAYSQKLLDDFKAENEELREQVKALEEENNQPEPPGCCKSIFDLLIFFSLQIQPLSLRFAV